MLIKIALIDIIIPCNSVSISMIGLDRPIMVVQCLVCEIYKLRLDKWNFLCVKNQIKLLVLRELKLKSGTMRDEKISASKIWHQKRRENQSNKIIYKSSFRAIGSIF